MQAAVKMLLFKVTRHDCTSCNWCWSTSVEQSTTSSRDFELSLSEFRRLLKMHLFGWRSRQLVTYF